MNDPVFLCSIRETVEGVDCGPTTGNQSVTVFFAAVSATSVDVPGIRPSMTGVGEFGLKFEGALVPLAAQFEPGKLYRLVPL